MEHRHAASQALDLKQVSEIVTDDAIVGSLLLERIFQRDEPKLRRSWTHASIPASGVATGQAVDDIDRHVQPRQLVNPSLVAIECEQTGPHHQNSAGTVLQPKRRSDRRYRNEERRMSGTRPSAWGWRHHRNASPRLEGRTRTWHLTDGDWLIAAPGRVEHVDQSRIHVLALNLIGQNVFTSDGALRMADKAAISCSFAPSVSTKIAA